MGYSPPKKQFDLKEFLKAPAKKKPGGKNFSFQRYPRKTTPSSGNAAATPETDDS